MCKKDCFENPTKVRCAKIVTIVAFIELIIGIACAIYGFIGSDHGAKIEFKSQNIPAPQTALAISALIVGLLTIIVGCLGLATAKYKQCCFACPFMILSFVIFILAILLAFFILLAPAYKKQSVDYMCDNKNIFTKAYKEFTLRTYNTMVYDNLVDRVMCTDQCKCTADAAIIKKYKDNTKIGDRKKSNGDASPWISSVDEKEVRKSWKECLDSPAMTTASDNCGSQGSKFCKALKELKGDNG